MEFVASDSRFKIVTRENGGLSAARNTGIEHSVGRYIAFIDSDDFIAPTYLEKLYNACEEIMLICHTVALLIILIRTV